MERIEELLECSLCLDRFKEPKVLPCQHTYCLRPCLQNLVQDNSVRCPECSASHNLPRKGVESLPSNFTIVRLLDRQKPHRQCICKECEMANGDVHNCNHCDESLCGNCIESHTRSLQQDLRRSTIQVRKLLTSLAESDYYLQERAKKLEENGRDIKRKISQSIERFVSELQSRKKCLFEEVDELVAMETGSIKREQEELDVNMTALTTHCKIAKDTCERHIILSNPEIQQLQNEILCLTQQGREHVQGNGISLDKVRQTIKLTLGDESVVLSAIANIATVSAHVQPTSEGDDPNEVLRGANDSPWTSERQPTQDSRGTEVLRQYRSKRRVKTYFGMNGSNFGQMNSPHGISSMTTDDIVVADTGNHRIQIFGANGQAKEVFGTEGKSAGHFNVVPDVCVTSRGRIVASDFHNDRIQIFDEQGRFTRMFGSKGSGNGQLNKPCGVATDEKGLIYVCDFGNGRVQVFSANGQFIRKFGSEENHLNKPSYLSVTSKGRVVVADSGNRLQVFDEYGRHLFQFGTKGTAGIVTDHHGNIIVADGCNQRVQVFTSDGIFVSCFGSKGSEPGMLKWPEGVCLLSDGSIAVSDRVNHRVQIF